MARSPSRMGNSVATMPMRLPWEIRWFVLPVAPKRPRLACVLAWRLKRQMKLGWLWSWRFVGDFLGGWKKGMLKQPWGGKEGWNVFLVGWWADFNVMVIFLLGPCSRPCYVYLTVVYLCLFHERQPTIFGSTTCSMSSACPQNVRKMERVWFHWAHLTMIHYAGSSPKNNQHTSNMWGCIVRNDEIPSATNLLWPRPTGEKFFFQLMQRSSMIGKSLSFRKKKNGRRSRYNLGKLPPANASGEYKFYSWDPQT